MIASFLIFLREGIEGSMVVSMLLAYLTRSNRSDLKHLVWLGVASAVAFSALAAFAIWFTVRSYDGTPLQAGFEAVTYLLAAVLLTFMTAWMRRQARSMRRDLERQMERAIEGSGAMLFLIAFLTVGREGVETAVFSIAIWLQSGAGAPVGAALGLLCAFLLAYVIYAMGRRIRMDAFFNVTSLLLVFFAAGLLGNAVQDFQQLGMLPVLTGVLWHTGQILPDRSTLGDILHSFFGYTEAPTGLQVLVYLGYLLVAFLTIWQRPVPPSRRITA